VSVANAEAATFAPSCQRLYFKLTIHQLAVQRVQIKLESVRRRALTRGGNGSGGGEEIVVAHLSDFHYDYGGESRLDPVLDAALDELRNAPRVDVILLTGDFVNHDPAPVDKLIDRFVRHLPAIAKIG